MRGEPTSKTPSDEVRPPNQAQRHGEISPPGAPRKQVDSWMLPRWLGGTQEVPMSDETTPGPSEPQDPELDASQVEYLKQRLQSEQNLPLAIVAGLVASLAGAAVWAGLTVATGYQIGFMAIGIGFLVGFAVRSAGKGITSVFGVIGAAFSLLGCAAGNLLAVSAMVAQAEDMPLMAVLQQLDLGLIQELMMASFSPMDLLFYAIALYYGYKLAFRQLTGDDLTRMLSGGAPA